MAHGDGLAGQVAVMTGASSGLGRATGEALARAGTSVALIARGESELASLAEEIATEGGPRSPSPAISPTLTA